MTDNVVDILKRIREGILDPKEISVSDRRVCVAYLRLEGYRQEEIAQIFKVHRLTIMRDEKANRKDAAKLVDEIDVKSVAGNLIVWGQESHRKGLTGKGLCPCLENSEISDQRPAKSGISAALSRTIQCSNWHFRGSRSVGNEKG